VADKVIGVDLLSQVKSVFANGGTNTGRAVILSTGSMGRGQRVKGEDELLGHGVSYCATCDAAFFRDQEVVVAGNSDRSHRRGLVPDPIVKRVHFLSPTPALKAPQALVDELLANQKVTCTLAPRCVKCRGETGQRRTFWCARPG
jgi:thioredoxin reductase (NADPH)